jgi:hypothetical protein
MSFRGSCPAAAGQRSASSPHPTDFTAGCPKVPALFARQAPDREGVTCAIGAGTWFFLLTPEF